MHRYSHSGVTPSSTGKTSANYIADVAVCYFTLLISIANRVGALIGIFSTGGVAIVASILRCYALYTYATTKDVAYDAIFVRSYFLFWTFKH